MRKREKVKKIYQKYDVKVSENYINGIMKNKKRLKGLMRMYKKEEIDSMNEMFQKENNNVYFTKEELEFARKIDLFDKNMVDAATLIWKYKSNNEMLKLFQKILNENSKNKEVIAGAGT